MAKITGLRKFLAVAIAVTASANAAAAVINVQNGNTINWQTYESVWALAMQNDNANTLSLMAPFVAWQQFSTVSKAHYLLSVSYMFGNGFTGPLWVDVLNGSDLSGSHIANYSLSGSSELNYFSQMFIASSESTVLSFRGGDMQMIENIQESLPTSNDGTMLTLLQNESLEPADVTLNDVKVEAVNAPASMGLLALVAAGMLYLRRRLVRL